MRAKLNLALCVLMLVLGLGAMGCSEDSTGPGDTPSSPEWRRGAGGALADLGLSVATDVPGNVFVAGYFQGRATFAGVPVDAVGGTDIYIAKYDASGIMQWVRTAGGNGTDTGWGLATDAAGNVVMTGYFQNTASFGTSQVTSAGGDDVFVAKYSASGNLLWVKSAGGTTEDRARGVTVDGSGNAIVAGRYEGTADFDGTMLTSTGGEDVFIAKYDSSGDLQWVVSAGGLGDDRAWGVRTDAIGNIVVTGLFIGDATFGSTVLSTSGAQDVFVAKYNTSGNLAWAKSAGGIGEEIGQDITVDRAGNILVTGSFEVTANFGTIALVAVDSFDVFIAKYTPLGNVTWAKSAGGDRVDQGISVATDNADNVIVTGIFADNASFGTQSLTSAGNWDIFTAKYASTGTLSWVQRAGGPILDQGLDVTTDGSGNIIGTGYYQATASFGSASMTTAGFEDVFIVKSGPNGLD